MKYEYVLTLSDVKEALKLLRNRNWLTQISGISDKLFLLICLASVCFGIKWKFIDHTISWGKWTMLTIPNAFYLRFSLTQASLASRLLRDEFPQGSERLSIDMDEDRILCTNRGISESRFTWRSVDSFAQNDKIAVMTIDEDRLLFFPTAGLTLEQREELRSLISHNVEKK